MNKPITDTQELIASVAALLIRTRANLADDGKISWMEMLGYVGEMPALRAAVSGVQNVPAELLDLTAEETQEIASQIGLTLVSTGFKHRTADITAEIIHASREIVHRVMRVLALPPVPEVIG